MNKVNKFIKNIVLFLLPYLVVFIGIEVALRKKSAYSSKREYIEKNGKEIKFLVLGNSTSLYGIDPSLIIPSDGYNLSFVSQSVDIDRILLEKYIDSLPKLKFVIIPAGYLSFNHELKNTVEDWRLYDYYHFMKISAKKLDINPYTPKSHSLIIAKGLRHSIRTIYYRLILNKKSLNKFGWGLDFESPINDSLVLHDFGKAVVKRHLNLKANSIKLRKDLLGIIELLSTRNIDLYMITFPTHKSYYSQFPIEKIEEYEQDFKKLDERYDNVYYLNYFKDTSFNINDFHDVDHLSRYGVEKLSNKIRLDIQK